MEQIKKITTHHQSPKTIRFMQNLAFALAAVIALNFGMKFFLAKLESETVRLFAFLSFRWILLSFGTILLFLIVKNFVDLRFFYFIEHIAHQMQKMVGKDPHEIFISRNRVRKWNIENLNPAIKKIAIPAWKNHQLMEEKKSQIKKILESNASPEELKKIIADIETGWETAE